MNRKISEMLSVIVGFIAQDLTAGAKTTAYIDVSLVGRIAVSMVSNDTAAGQAFSVQFKQATDSSGTGAKNLGDAITVTADSSGKLSIIADRVAAGFDDGYSYAAAEITQTDSPTTISSATAVLLTSEQRFS